MTRARGLAWLLMLGLGVAPGCRDTADDGRPAGAAVRAGPAGHDAGPAEPAAERGPDADPVAVLGRFAAVLPVRVQAVAVVPAEVLRQAARDLASAIPIPLVLRDPADIVGRVKSLYGLDLSRPGPWCVLAWLEVDGLVLVCESHGPDPVERPFGAVGWNAWGFHGHRVATAGVTVATGAGFIVVGSEAAVRRVAMVQGGAWPSLLPAMARIEAEVRRAGRGGPGEDASLWFLDPQVAPWCLSGVCDATAVFASRQGLRVTAEARPGMESVLQSTLEVLWRRNVVERFQATPLPDAVAKPADLLVRRGIVERRGTLVTLRAAPGDPVFLAAALYPEVVLRLLGAPE